MRKLAPLLAMLILLSVLSQALAESQIDPEKIHFYMYGAKTCPHCRKMKEEIPKAYGNESFTYYELIDNQENQALFAEQYKYTGITGVPAIGIAYDGKLVAIVEGEYNVSATPKIIEAALENDGLILLVGGKAYLVKNESVIEKLQTIYVEHKMPEESQTSHVTESSSASPSSEGTEAQTNTSKTCGPAILIALILVPAVLRKRR